MNYIQLCITCLKYFRGDSNESRTMNNLIYHSAIVFSVLFAFFYPKPLLGMNAGIINPTTSYQNSPDTVISYPMAHRDNTVDTYFGTKVPAPYQWMENLDSPAVKDWVEKENKLTFSYLDKIPVRNWIHGRLTIDTENPPPGSN